MLISLRKTGLVIFLLLLLTACSTAAEETPLPPTNTPIPPTNTATAIPPTETPIPPTDTATPVPPTATPTITAVPAGQDSIAVGSYEIVIEIASIVEGALMMDREIEFNDGLLMLPIGEQPGSFTLVLSIRLRYGELASFRDYVCQVLEPDGSLTEMEKIQALEVYNGWKIYWFSTLSSDDPGVMIYCPDDVLIDLTPLLSQ